MRSRLGGLTEIHWPLDNMWVVTETKTLVVNRSKKWMAIWMQEKTQKERVDGLDVTGRLEEGLSQREFHSSSKREEMQEAESAEMGDR